MHHPIASKAIENIYDYRYSTRSIQQIVHDNNKESNNIIEFEVFKQKFNYQQHAHKRNIKSWNSYALLDRSYT